MTQALLTPRAFPAPSRIGVLRRMGSVDMAPMSPSFLRTAKIGRLVFIWRSEPPAPLVERRREGNPQDQSLHDVLPRLDPRPMQVKIELRLRRFRVIRTSCMPNFEILEDCR